MHVLFYYILALILKTVKPYDMKHRAQSHAYSSKCPMLVRHIYVAFRAITCVLVVP
jgi:hypothetical protein